MNERNKKAPILSQEDGHQKIEAHMSTHVDIKSPSKQKGDDSMNEKDIQKHVDELDHTYTIPIVVSIFTSLFTSCAMIWLFSIFGK